MREILDLFIGESPAKRGDRKVQKGDFEGAIREFNQALSLNPNDVMSYVTEVTHLHVWETINKR